jgi:MraZ protein
MLFMGTYNNTIDAKNRMIVPVKHRERLGSRCILTRGLDTCLYIYTMDEWEKQMEKIEKLPESDPKVRAFIRHFFANAAECEFDKQGRIIIPQELISYAKIHKNLVTMGTMNKVEIWAKEVWTSPDNTNRMDTEEFNQALFDYSF